MELLESFARQGEKVDSGIGGNATGFTSSLSSILKAIIGVMGIFCVIFVIVGGVQYMTSAGDTSKVEKAKKTILYAVIGLIVCALAFLIVQFVIGNILK